jgi:predicted regulator of Ras-like GTPase activity (Roadblock/LC7/MglB family)
MRIEKQLTQWCTEQSALFVKNHVSLSECLVLTPDGFAVSSRQGAVDPSDSRVARLATIASSLHAVSNAISDEAEIGPQKFVMIDAHGGKFVVSSFQIAEHELILAMLGTASATPGTILVLANSFSAQAEIATRNFSPNVLASEGATECFT